MKYIFALCFGLFSVQSFAKVDTLCFELKSEQVRLGLLVSNLANANSTRTPEGGAYKPYVIKSCINGGCDVERSVKLPILKYLPDHPDADRNGYVAYPNIDLAAEYTQFNMTSTKLKWLTRKKACGTKVPIEIGHSTFTVRYEGRGIPDIKEDSFNVLDGQIVSWIRIDMKGEATTANFAKSGEVQSYRAD